jgi:uncharacterized protein YndB with AHSA1/START domain
MKPSLAELPVSIERTVVIRAKRSTVFRYFTDSERFAAWWGAGSSIDPRPGGKVEIRYPNGVTAGGEVIEVVEGQRVVFSFGYDDPDKPIAREGSRVTVTLTEERGGTCVRLEHAVATEAIRDAHVPGWRFQLSTFANVVAKESEGDVMALIDRYFAVWSNADPTSRVRSLDGLVTDDVELHDAFACIRGKSDLAEHIGASQMHMPGIRLERDGAPRYCQGTALVDWSAKLANGETKARGTNVIDVLYAPEGRIARVTGYWRG